MKPLRPALLASLLCVGLAACGSDSAPEPVPDVGDTQDVQAPDTTAMEDAADPLEDTSEPAKDAPAPLDFVVPPPETTVPAGKTRITLNDGTEVEGELVATYDHSIWWEAEDLVTYAIFDPTAFAEWPEDRSLQFVSSADVQQLEHGPALDGDSAFTQFVRIRGFVLERVPLEGVAHILTGQDSYHLEENGRGDFAWDLTLTDDDGNRYFAPGNDNTDYLVWDAPVYLATPGVVVELIRDAPDNAPGSYPKAAEENMIGIGVGGHYYHYYLHFREGTIPSKDDGTCEPVRPGVTCIQVGKLLPAGTYLGRVGNSGTSLEPHLHLTMLYYDHNGTPQRSWSVPTEWVDVYSATAATGPASQVGYLTPQTGSWVSSSPF